MFECVRACIMYGRGRAVQLNSLTTFTPPLRHTLSFGCSLTDLVALPQQLRPREAHARCPCRLVWLVPGHVPCSLLQPKCYMAHREPSPPPMTTTIAEMTKCALTNRKNVRGVGVSSLILYSYTICHPRWNSVRELWQFNFNPSWPHSHLGLPQLYFNLSLLQFSVKLSISV